MTTTPTENHVDSLDTRPLADLTDAELEAAIREGVHGALTEESLRAWCRRYGVDRAQVMPSFGKDAPERRTRTVGPRGSRTRISQREFFERNA